MAAGATRGSVATLAADVAGRTSLTQALAELEDEQAQPATS
ncbi:hypothetical protein [Streptomyces sp. NPDC012510]